MRSAGRSGSRRRSADTTAVRQVRLAEAADLERAWRELERSANAAGLLLERELDFACELSVVVARGLDGRTVPFAVGRNRHDAGILFETLVPAPSPVTAAVAVRAQELAIHLADALDVVGTLTVEMFLLADGSLVVNELAPRVHNSGHWTIEGAATSQFEQHIRAICGLPLGDPTAHRAAAMINILGTGERRGAYLAGLAEALEDPAPISICTTSARSSSAARWATSRSSRRRPKRPSSVRFVPGSGSPGPDSRRSRHFVDFVSADSSGRQGRRRIAAEDFGSATMKFVMFTWVGEQGVVVWEAMDTDARVAYIDLHKAWFRKHREHLAGGEELAGPETARTLRRRRGLLSTTDGPFIETKELLGGVIVLEADDLEAAVAMAGDWPALGTDGNGVEIRPTSSTG